jgi:hypothetical protein
MYLPEISKAERKEITNLKNDLSVAFIQLVEWLHKKCFLL